MNSEPKSKGEMLIETSVLISFLKILRFDILTLLDRELLITEEVDNEINGAKYPFQREHLDMHLQNKSVRIVRLELTETLLTKAHMQARGAFGTGECSTAAKAIELSAPAAMTDEDAIRSFQAHYPSLKVLSALDLICELLAEKRLLLSAADLILPSWAKEAQNPVPMIVSSFRECCPNH